MRSAEQVAAMSCPVCRVPLAMSDRQGIEIDYCPQCRGVWLDRGELDKIIERSAPPPVAPAPQAASQPAPVHPAPAQPQYQPPPPGYAHGNPWGGKPGYGYKKRKSWLEDIFD